MSVSADDTQRLRRLGPSFAPAPGDDVHEYLGQIMGATARTGRKVDDLTIQIGTLSREVSGLRADIEQDRRALVHGAASKASTHTSNRMAGLLGALFLLYTEAAPYLHELWKMVHR